MKILFIIVCKKVFRNTCLNIFYDIFIPAMKNCLEMIPIVSCRVADRCLMVRNGVIKSLKYEIIAG